MPVPAVVAAPHPGLVTFGIDPRDYAALAARLGGSALASPRLASAQKAVLVIGPVDTDACAYPFDQLTLQEKLQTALHRAGRLEASFAANVLPEAGAQAALVRINRLNFEKNQLEAGDELRALAATANIDYLLFGRLSARETLVRGTVEVTYVFNWKIGDCRSGLLVWSADEELTKRGPAGGAPLWFDLGKPDTPTARFATGAGADAGAAHAAAAAALAERLNRNELADRDAMRPIAPAELAGATEVVASRALAGGARAWVMLRLPQPFAAGRVALRTRAYARWREVHERIERVRALPREKRRAELAPLRETIARFDADFPAGAENFIRDELPALAVAELEVELGNPWAARRRLESVAERARPGPGRDEIRRRAAILPAGAAERETFLLRRELEGRIVRLRCACSTGGKNRAWAKAAAELQRWLEQFDARVRIEAIEPAGDLRRFPEGASALAADETLLVFWVHGDPAERPDEREPSRRNHAFAGELWAAFGRVGQWSHPVSAQVATGWTIFGPDMTLDLLALEAARQWRRALSGQLARTAE